MSRTSTIAQITEAKRLEGLAQRANEIIGNDSGRWVWPIDFDHYVMLKIAHAYRNSYRCASCGRHFSSGFHVAGYYTNSRYRGGYWKRWCGGSCARNILEKVRDQFATSAAKTAQLLSHLEGLNQVP